MLKGGGNLKKVLVFGMTDNPGGVESFLMAYYRKLDKSKIQFDFLCNNKTVAYEDEINALGGRVFKICARSVNPALYKAELEGFFKEHASEYCAIWVNVCSLANIDYLKAAKKYGIKTRIIHSHNAQNMDSALRGVLHKINRLSINKYATHFWACTDLAADFFYNAKVKASKNFREVKNAIDVSAFSFSSEARENLRRELALEDSLVFGNVGRLHFQKNQSFLLDIFAEISKKRDDARLVLIGGGEDEAMLKEKTASLGLSDKVLFLGVRSDVPQLMSALDVFLLPSKFEGLGIVLIEAQASGLLSFTSAEVVPEDAKVTDLLTFIPLSKSPNEWAEEILSKSENQRRPDTLSEITQAGYNIDTQIDSLQNFFETAAEL